MIRRGEIGGRDQCDPEPGHRSASFEVGKNGIENRMLSGFKSQN
jgi:hypothetical protein